MRCLVKNPDILKRDILIDAIVGKGFHGLEDAEHFTNLGYAEFTGNQHNYEWEWIRGKLNKLHTMDLERVYSRKVE